MGEPIGFAEDEPVYMPSARHPHLYLLGSNNSGKTELFKSLIFSLVKKRDSAVVVIDPAGELSHQIAMWPLFAGTHDLVYCYPRLVAGKTPTINPFYTRYATNYSEAVVDQKRVIAQELRDAFAQISASEAPNLSDNMRNLLMPCILTLLDRPGSTIHDLLRFVDPDDPRQKKPVRNRDLVEWGQKLTHHETLPDFFTHSFRDADRWNQTKKAVATRLQGLLDNGFFYNLTCGENKINLDRLIRERRVIVFNLSRIGRDEGRAFGRLVIALIQGIALRREAGRKHTPIHLFVDEIHHFASPALEVILNEARKYKLYIYMAQQHLGYGMPPTTRDIITTNANVLISGFTQRPHRRSVASIIGCEPEDLGELGQGEFYMSYGSKVLRFQGRDDLLGFSYSMTPPAWMRLVGRQLNSYYRPRRQQAKQEPVRAEQDQAARPSAEADDQVETAATEEP